MLADMARGMAGAPLRIADTTAKVDTSRYPQIDANAVDLALVDVQETMSRIASRRTSPRVCIQALAVKLFEGAK